MVCKKIKYIYIFPFLQLHTYSDKSYTCEPTRKCSKGTIKCGDCQRHWHPAHLQFQPWWCYVNWKTWCAKCYASSYPLYTGHFFGLQVSNHPSSRQVRAADCTATRLRSGTRKVKEKREGKRKEWKKKKEKKDNAMARSLNRKIILAEGGRMERKGDLGVGSSVWRRTRRWWYVGGGGSQLAQIFNFRSILYSFESQFSSTLIPGMYAPKVPLPGGC